MAITGPDQSSLMVSRSNSRAGHASTASASHVELVLRHQRSDLAMLDLGPQDLLVLGRLTIYTLSTHTQQALLLSINNQAYAERMTKWSNTDCQTQIDIDSSNKSRSNSDLHLQTRTCSTLAKMKLALTTFTSRSNIDSISFWPSHTRIWLGLGRYSIDLMTCWTNPGMTDRPFDPSMTFWPFDPF